MVSKDRSHELRSCNSARFVCVTTTVALQLLARNGPDVWPRPHAVLRRMVRLQIRLQTSSPDYVAYPAKRTSSIKGAATYWRFAHARWASLPNVYGTPCLLSASLSQLAHYAAYLRVNPGVENCFLRHAPQLPCYLGGQI